MKNHFKPRIEKMNRYQTSLGRNLREEYDLSKMKFRRNPYAARLKKPIPIAS